MLKEFKQDLADTISALLADALVEVFHQKFSSHIVSRVQGKVNGVIGRYVRTGLKSDRTEEKLKAGQNNRYISYMPGDPNAKHKSAGEAGKRSESHAEKIRNPVTAGTILDIRVLSEATGTKVVILTEDSHGRLTKMQELNPGAKATNQTVTLIYRPKSAQHPDGHYDVRINNQTVNIDSESKSCLFHALARGMKPEASEEEIALEADRLRSVEADTLLTHPGQWEPFIKRKEWTEAIRGGDWYMAEGAAPTKRKIKLMKETEEALEQETGKVKLYEEWQQDAKKRKGIGKFINGDHQPPVNSILKANELNQNSKLATAMLEVATASSPLDKKLIEDVYNTHGLGLPTVYVPEEVHREFPSTKSQRFRDLLAETISKDDVAATFKLTILGAMPRSMLDSSKEYNNFQSKKMSPTRLKVFQDSFPEHSKALVDKWFNLLGHKTDLMKPEIKKEMEDWINAKKYEDQNDPFRNQVISTLQSVSKPGNVTD
ncbi:uncharacterized protein LOC119916786 [Micropterus salmoides]|uniref:uncharacterized protein LOC119916786 n=1 Tax=Micropterus salmoides TaxID=27706 RepID=UPI0018ED09D1|nr:uncharacterized protein LOC119916786 [Micropterus salmoides]